MDLTVGIINWNTKDLLKDCLASIQRGKYLDIVNVVVVDNNSADGSQEMVKDAFPQVNLIENSSNVGYAAAANQILRSSETSYIFLLNSDTEILPGSMELLIDSMKQHPDAGVIGPLVLNPDDSVQYSCRNFPSFADAMVHAFLGAFSPSNPYSKRYKMVECDRKNDREVDWVSGAAVCLRKDAVKSIDYFDEDFYMYVEDMDLCYRLRQAGWKVYYTPQAKVYHHVGQSSKQISMKMIVEHQKSIYLFYSRLYNDKPWRYLKVLIAIGLFFRGLLLIFTERLRGARLEKGRSRKRNKSFC